MSDPEDRRRGELDELEIQVRKLRALQKRYFRTKDFRILDECKQVEKRVDLILDSLAAGPTLF